jgi:hypothetical protein
MRDDRKGRSAYRQYMQNWISKISGCKNPHELDPEWKMIRQGWYLGCKSFREKLLDRLEDLRSGRKASCLSSNEVKLHNQRQAKHLLTVGMQRLKITQDTLQSLPKGASEKKVLAWYVRSQTTVTNEWLSQKLYLGHASNISRLVTNVNNKKDKKIQRLKMLLT